MKYLSITFLIVLSSCGGSLSDEQRQKIREGLEEQKIIKVSDAEIMSEALRKGQSVLSQLRKGYSPAAVDSLAKKQKVAIRFLTPGKSNARAIEQELIEAYIAGMTTGDNQENLQKLWNNEQRDDYDSLLFSQPEVAVNADGVEELQGIWNIYMARKDIVLQISRNR